MGGGGGCADNEWNDPTLPDLNRNVSFHERESLVCLDKGLNEVSVTLLFLFLYIY